MVEEEIFDNRDSKITERKSHFNMSLNFTFLQNDAKNISMASDGLCVQCGFICLGLCSNPKRVYDMNSEQT